MIRNYPSLIGFILGIGCVAVYIFFLTPRQFGEVMRPRNWLTRLRWIILSMLVITIMSSIPPLVYQYFRAVGHTYSVLQNISTVSSNVAKVSTTVLLVLVYTYRRKDD